MSEEMRNAINQKIAELVESGVLKYNEDIKESGANVKKDKVHKSVSKATRPLTIEEFELLINTIESGFEYEETIVKYVDGAKETIILPVGEIKDAVFQKGALLETKKKKFRPNHTLSFILMLEGNLGMRIGDILALTPNSFIPTGNDTYKLNIIEQKTGKDRTFTVTSDTMNAVETHVKEHHLRGDDLLFNVKERAVQKQLKIVSSYLKLKNISTHSFRKFFAMRIYVENGYNIELTRQVLQHSNIAVTQKYLGITSHEVEQAIQNHNYWNINKN